MAIPFEITVSDHRVAHVVTLAGELDIATADLLRGAIRNLVRAGRTRLVIDASTLRFCDSSGLEALLDARNDIVRSGGSMRLAGAGGTLLTVLHITGAWHRFSLDETLSDALAALPTADVSMV